MRENWCVVQTQPMKELVAKQHLLDQGYEVYLPQFKKIRRHARKVEEVLTPLFPRYLFVKLDLEKTPWRSINGTRGVSYLLMSEPMVPACVPTKIIRDIQSQEIESGVVPVNVLFPFIKGERVRVIEGAFKDQTAIFDQLSDKNRVDILLNLLGREIKISLPTYMVEAA